MDRHEMRGATPEEVAEAHVKDLELAPDYKVQMLAYWYDPETEGVFCIANAGGPDDLVALHRDAHGQVPNEIIPVSEDNVLRFLGKIEDPVGPAEVTSAFRTILFTDLEGSTSLLQELGEASFMVLLTEHDLIIRRALVASKGREVKHTGDGIMASFDDVGHALECAAAIQDGYEARSKAGPDTEIRVRIGMAAGEPVDHNDDLFGTAVNLASRICDAAEAGHILCSDMVQDLGAKHGYTFEEVQARALKGFSGKVRVFELRAG